MAEHSHNYLGPGAMEDVGDPGSKPGRMQLSQGLHAPVTCSCHMRQNLQEVLSYMTGINAIYWKWRKPTLLTCLFAC